MAQRRLVKFIEPHRKYNLKFDVETDFALSSYPELSGKYIKEVPIPWMDYKWFYATKSVFKVYFLISQYIIPAVQNVYIPLGKVQKIILVRPDGLLSGNIYFQFWLMNEKEVKILDVYEEINFSVSAPGYEIIEFPFPTYELELLMLIPDPSNDWGFDIDIYPFSTSDVLVLDDVSGLKATDTIINTIYKYDFVGGSGAISNPHYARPSFRTKIKISNDDTENPLLSLRLQIVSFED